MRILRPRVPRGVRRLRHLLNRFVLVLPTPEGLWAEVESLAEVPVIEVARRLGSVSRATKR